MKEFFNNFDDWGDILTNTYENINNKNVIYLTYKKPFELFDMNDGTTHYINKLEVIIDTSVPLSGMNEMIYDSKIMGFLKTFKAININYCNDDTVIYSKSIKTYKEITIKFRVFIDCNKDTYVVHPYIQYHAVGVPLLFSTSDDNEYDVTEVKMSHELADYILNGCTEKYKSVYTSKIKFI